MENFPQKRVTFFIGTLMQGGAERVVSILSKALIEEGIDVQILLYYNKPIFYEIDSKIPVTIVEKETKSASVLKNLCWIRKYIKENTDILLSFLAPFNIIALIAHWGLKSKIVVADRNDPKYIPNNCIIRKMRDFLYFFADGVVVQTRSNQEYFSKRIRRKSIVIYNPINLGNKTGLALRTPKRTEIVSVGRLMPQKNQIMLIKAFAKLHKDNPEYILKIYGEGQYRQELEMLIHNLNLDKCVYLPGSSTKIFDEIACAQLFVLSSNYEGMPNALIEAMCLGLPCISTKVSGATDLIQNNVNGILVEVGNEDELYNSMLRLIKTPELREKYASRATEINNKLEVNIIMKTWIEYLKQID